MISQTFSRTFLQMLPNTGKLLHISLILKAIGSEIRRVAATGKTSYMYDPNDRIYNFQPPTEQPNPKYKPYPILTNDDLIPAFQEMFPGCTISYQETWVNTDVLMKGIVIDWS